MNDIFKGTISTDVELRRLIEKIGKPEKGQRWSYSEIEDIVGEKYGTARFRTITNRWRNKVRRDYLLCIACVAGDGFECLNDPATFDTAQKKFKQAGKVVGKAIKLHAIVDRRELPKEQRDVYDRSSAAFARIASTIKTERRMLESHPVKEIPNE